MNWVYASSVYVVNASDKLSIFYCTSVSFSVLKYPVFLEKMSFEQLQKSFLAGVIFSRILDRTTNFVSGIRSSLSHHFQLPVEIKMAASIVSHPSHISLNYARYTKYIPFKLHHMIGANLLDIINAVLYACDRQGLRIRALNTRKCE